MGDAVVYQGDEYLRFMGSASRTWHRPKVIWDDLTECLEYARSVGKTLVIVHGDADGGDQIMKLFGEVNDGAVEEGHPADWSAPCRTACKAGHRKTRKDGTEYCPMAANYRNDDMVALGIWRAAVYIHNNSHGTTNAKVSIRRAGVTPRERRYSD